MHFRRIITALGLALSISGAAWAQRSTNSPAAEALYNEGRKLLDAGKYPEACAKLEESQRLDPGMGTQFFLADCYEKLGRIATAWQLFRDVEVGARNAGRADRLDLAKKRADALESRVPKLVVEVPWGDKVSGAEVHRLDGREDVPIGHAQWGMAVPVDPGRYTLKASAPGKKPLETGIDVPEGKTTTVSIPELAELPAAPAGSAPGADRGSGLRTAGWITGAVGLTTLSAGIIVGLVGVVRHGDSKSECDPNNLCSQKGVDARSEGRTLADAGTVVFFIGAAAIAAGATMVLFAPKATSRAAIVPLIGPGALGVQGRF